MYSYMRIRVSMDIHMFKIYSSIFMLDHKFFILCGIFRDFRFENKNKLFHYCLCQLGRGSTIVRDRAVLRVIRYNVINRFCIILDIVINTNRAGVRLTASRRPPCQAFLHCERETDSALLGPGIRCTP